MERYAHMKVAAAMVALLIIAMAPAMARAEQKSYVTLNTYSEVEVQDKDKDGKPVTRIARAGDTVMVPGDVVIFRTTYENVSDKEVGNVVIENPVPEHMIYRHLSATGEGTDITFSIDGGKKYDTPNRLIVKTDDGRMRPAATSDYTHIQWKFKSPLKPGQKGEVSFRAVIE